MIQLHHGNVLLKPSHRRQLMTFLRRVMKLGERLGNFVLDLTFSRTGRSIEVRANVKDSQGQFNCRSRASDWRDAIREISRMIAAQLNQHRLAKLA